jgi:cytochrome c biogenesis protein
MAREDKQTTQGWVDFLASLKVTVYTMIALGLAVLIGTIAPQEGVSVDPQVLAEKMGQPVWRALHALGFFNVFHSTWFFLLVALLVVNLVLCTLRNLQRTQRQLADAGVELDDKIANRMPLAKKLSLGDSIDEVTRLVAERFRKVGKVERVEKESAIFLFAQNSPLARYGNTIIHLSILFILAGAMVRLLFGIEGQLMLPEGGQQNVFDPGNGDLQRLPFEVRCDKFEAEFYAGGKRPKEYRSALVILAGGKEIARKTIKVNDPLSAGGFRFFQATYGSDSFPILHLHGRGVDVTQPFLFKQVQSIPGQRDGLLFDDAREEAGKVATHLRVNAGEQTYEDWLTEGGEAKNFGPYQIALVGHKTGQYTGILVTADPGVRLVWFGAALFFIGLFWALFTSHRRVWARVTKDEILLAASASKAREQMAEWFARLIGELEKKLACGTFC